MTLGGVREAAARRLDVAPDTRAAMAGATAALEAWDDSVTETAAAVSALAAARGDGAAAARMAALTAALHAAEAAGRDGRAAVEAAAAALAGDGTEAVAVAAAMDRTRARFMREQAYMEAARSVLATTAPGIGALAAVEGALVAEAATAAMAGAAAALSVGREAGAKRRSVAPAAASSAAAPRRKAPEALAASNGGGGAGTAPPGVSRDLFAASVLAVAEFSRAVRRLEVFVATRRTRAGSAAQSCAATLVTLVRGHTSALLALDVGVPRRGLARWRDGRWEGWGRGVSAVADTPHWFPRRRRRRSSPAHRGRRSDASVPAATRPPAPAHARDATVLSGGLARDAFAALARLRLGAGALKAREARAKAQSLLGVPAVTAALGDCKMTLRAAQDAVPAVDTLLRRSLGLRGEADFESALLRAEVAMWRLDAAMASELAARALKARSEKAVAGLDLMESAFKAGISLRHKVSIRRVVKVRPAPAVRAREAAPFADGACRGCRPTTRLTRSGAMSRRPARHSTTAWEAS